MARLARDLGYTLVELAERITPEEVYLWGLIYQNEQQEQEKALKTRRR